MDLMDEYRPGSRFAVWQELRRLGDRARDPRYLPEARAVCDEMARRARHDVELLVERLTGQGYAFHTNTDAYQPMVGFIPATPDAEDLVEWLDHQPFGPIPLTVSSWIRLVGDVWFVGTHPYWEQSDEADPLVIQLEGSHYADVSIRDHVADEYEEWRKWSAEEPREAREFILEVAPDRLTKANISGGAPYGFYLPDGCADGLFQAEADMPFVQYLNLVFANGGFPAASTGHWMLKRELAKGLLPL